MGDTCLPPAKGGSAFRSRRTEQSVRTCEETGIKFPLLVDGRREAYRAVGLKKANLLHLLRPGNARARKRAQAAGHRQVRLGQNPFQLGGSFVFGPGNVDHYAHISQTFGDSAQPVDLLAAIPARSQTTP